MTEYTFANPYEFEGKTYEKLEFDLYSLKGSDISAVKKQYAGAGNFSPVPSADSDFCALILCRVLKQPIEFMEQMGAKDYTKLTQMVSNFLLA